MARRGRCVLPDHLHQLMLRGNNAHAVFMDDEDRKTWLQLAASEAANHRVRVHAYVLLQTQIHLLATPEDVGGLSRWMQAVGRAYVAGFNRRHGRSGTLWEGRFRGGVLQAARYALACMAYFDLLAPAQGLAGDAAAWHWSSYGHYAGLRSENWLNRPEAVWGLGNTPFAREAAYVRMVQAGLSLDLTRRLADNATFGWPLGDREFLQQVQAMTGRATQRAVAGRPKRAAG